jgi:hypothetical protein
LRAHPYGGPLQAHLTTGFVYSDCQVDDVRLVVLNARDEPSTGVFNISHPARGRSETPQPICHPRDLTLMYWISPCSVVVSVGMMASSVVD